MVGVVTAQRREGQNLNFAIPSSQIVAFLKGPCNSRELWRGSGINEEENDAYFSMDFAFRGVQADSGKTPSAIVESPLYTAYLQTKDEKYREAVEILASVEPSSCGRFEYLYHYALALALEERAHDAMVSHSFNVEPGLSAQEGWERLMRQLPDNRNAIVSLKKAIFLNPRFSPLTLRFRARAHRPANTQRLWPLRIGWYSLCPGALLRIRSGDRPSEPWPAQLRVAGLPNGDRP